MALVVEDGYGLGFELVVGVEVGRVVAVGSAEGFRPQAMVICRAVLSVASVIRFDRQGHNQSSLVALLSGDSAHRNPTLSRADWIVRSRRSETRRFSADGRVAPDLAWFGMNSTRHMLSWLA